MSSRAYISAIDNGRVTVSGPPSRLNQLIRGSDYFRTAKTVKLPVHGLYNAAHMYRQEDIAEILQTTMNSAKNTRHPGAFTLLSTATGKAFTASRIPELLERILSDMLIQPVRWDAVMNATASLVNDSKTSPCRVFASAASFTIQGLVIALKSGSVLEVLLEDLSISDSENLSGCPGSTSFASSKIAIVGMAGRFPDAASCEELWQILEKGLDVHRRVSKRSV